MTIAVYLPDSTPYSMKFCAWNIMAILQEKYAVHFIEIKSLDELPMANADIYWDPRCGGGIAPALKFKALNKPLVLTVHGMAMFTLPLDTFYFSFSDKINGQLKRWKERLKWKIMQPHIAHIMTVSEYTKSEVIDTIHFPKEKITAVWNGINHNNFHPVEKKQDSIPFFFTVISYQKKKNFERLLEAYQLLDEETRPRLIAIVKPYTITDSIKKIKGLEIINTPIEESAIINYYQQALALIFVSLHEGFGLPIAEAMACGTPVITSNSTSCKEIAGDAAILVNPTNINEIKNAMEQIINDRQLQQSLSKKGMERAAQFRWEKTADAFHAILQKL